MGMFGARGKAAATTAKYDPSQLSGSDKMVMFGAMLRDMGAGLNGQQGNALLNAQALLAGQQQQARKTAFGQQLREMMQPTYQDGPAMNIQPPSSGAPSQTQYAPPVRTSNGLDANDPRLAGLVMDASDNDYDMSKVMDVFKLQQPDVRYDRGFGYDGKTGASHGGYHPNLDNNLTPTFGADGAVSGVSLLPGAADAASQMTSATERVKAGYNTVQTADDQGRPVTTTALRIADRPMVGQTPQAKAFGEASGKAAGEAYDAAREGATKANQTLDLLSQAEGLLKGGNVITGFGADQRLTAERAAATILKDPKAAARVADTETYQNLVSRQVLPLLKQMGASNSITDTDREFIKGIVGGSITLNAETMRRVIEIGKVEAARTQGNYQNFPKPGAAQAAPPPTQRKPGQVYDTPRGPMRWTGTGWVQN